MPVSLAVDLGVKTVERVVWGVLGVLGALLPPRVQPRPVVVADNGPQLRRVPLPRQDADLLVSSVVLAWKINYLCTLKNIL